MSDPEEQSSEALDRMLDVTKDGFAKVGEAIGEQTSRIRTFETEQALQGEALKRVLHLLDGNGVPPLAVRLANLEKDNEHEQDQLEQLNEKMDRMEQTTANRMWELLKPVIAAALAAGGAALVMGA